MTFNVGIHQNATMFEAAVTSDHAATRQDTVGMSLAQRLQQHSESVAEILAEFQSLREELLQLRDTAVVSREVAARLVARVVDLEEKMNRLATGIEKLDGRVAEIRADVADLKRKVPWWTTVAALLLSLLPVWFAVSQVVTALQGWRLIRGHQLQSPDGGIYLKQGPVQRKADEQ